jgi:dTDP-4-amino-4,6-dideoxygalactose transaminase
MMLPFNKPYLTGEETNYIKQAVHSGKISGNGIFTQKCQNFFENKYGIKKALLTTSCTDALEMCALLLNIKEGDEIIMPSYTFVSTANAFVLRGAKIIFCDSKKNQPNIDETKIEKLISERTKAIVVVHYAGVACEMDEILSIAKKHSLFVVEDAAQAIESYYKGRPLGSIGHLATFSFHETKNIQCGEGGLLAINDKQFMERAEIIWQKGTNRSAFFRGEIDKYGWVDIGSSFLPSEIVAAFLWAQLENLKMIQERRKNIWENYQAAFQVLKNNGVRIPCLTDTSTNNAHMYYLVCNSLEERNQLINNLQENKINAVFHYIPLHSSAYFNSKYNGEKLINCDNYSNCIIRLPMYFELNKAAQVNIINCVLNFYS